MGISYRKHDNGSWEYRIVYTDTLTHKQKEKSKRGYRTKAEAKSAAVEVERLITNGYEQTDMPLEKYLWEWLEIYKKPILRKNTYEIHRRNIESKIVPYFKQIKLQKITPLKYQEFLNHYVDKGYSRRTVEIIHGTMYGAMEKAFLLQKITLNPCKGAVVATKKSNREDKGLQYIPTDYIKPFMVEAYKYGFEYYIFYKTLLETGLRKGEAAALQWGDIDLKEKMIHVNKTIDFTAKDPKDFLGETKTYGSNRYIKISNNLALDLQNNLKWQNDNKLALGDSYNHTHQFVLARKNGIFMSKSTLYVSFKRILEQAGIPQLPIHSTRHTHAVMLLESGASMKYIQDRLGHKSMQVTSDVYSHISKKLEGQTIEQFENYMNKNV